jgi:hypothetical protein
VGTGAATAMLTRILRHHGDAGEAGRCPCLGRTLMRQKGRWLSARSGTTLLGTVVRPTGVTHAQPGKLLPGGTTRDSEGSRE